MSLKASSDMKLTDNVLICPCDNIDPHKLLGKGEQRLNLLWQLLQAKNLNPKTAMRTLQTRS